MSISIGTSDAQKRPECTRAVGVRVADGGLVILVPTPAGDRTLANLRETSRVAVITSRPLDYRTYQIKGRVRGFGAPSDEDLSAQQRWSAAFVEQLVMVGLDRATVRRWKLSPCVAVAIEVEGVFVQTPGPGAGRSL